MPGLLKSSYQFVMKLEFNFKTYKFESNLCFEYNLQAEPKRLANRGLIRTHHTVVTWIFTPMIHLFVRLNISLLCSMILTLVTWIFNAFMLHLFVSFKMSFPCCLILTMVTWLCITFLHGIFVVPQSSLLRFLIVIHEYLPACFNLWVLRWHCCVIRHLCKGFVCEY